MRLTITAKTFESKRSRKALKNVQPVREKAEANIVGTYAPSSCVSLSEKNIAFFESKKGEAQLARLDARIEKQRDRETARKLAIEALTLNLKKRENVEKRGFASVSDDELRAYFDMCEATYQGERSILKSESWSFEIYVGQRDILADCILKAAIEDTCNALHDGQRWSFGEACNAVRKLYGLFKWAVKQTHDIEEAAYEQLVERTNLNGKDAPGLKIARKLMAMLNRGTYRVTNGHGVVVCRV